MLSLFSLIFMFVIVATLAVSLLVVIGTLLLLFIIIIRLVIFVVQVRIYLQYKKWISIHDIGLLPHNVIKKPQYLRVFKKYCYYKKSPDNINNF